MFKEEFERLARFIRTEPAPVDTAHLVPGDCWAWQGWTSGRRRINPDRPDDGGRGYGKCRFRGKKWMAHRATFTIFTGTDLGDTVLDHLCRNRICCNPLHVERTDVRVNTLRGNAILFKIMQKYHPDPEGTGPWDDE